MPTTIRVTCPTCGEIDLLPGDLTLSYDHATYYFECPTCGVVVRKQADQKIEKLLLSAGVGVEDEPQGSLLEYSEPRLTIPHPETHAGGKPITVDDVIEFHFSIDEELDKLLNT